MNVFEQQAVRFRNELAQSCSILIGIVQGVLADKTLADAEIKFLADWLDANESIATTWPGNVLHEKLTAALADGVISADERSHLVDTLAKLVGGCLDDMARAPLVASLALDAQPDISFPGQLFVLTGEFAYGSRKQCELIIQSKGGGTTSSISKKVNYVVVGGLGSPEWKHGSFGTKIERALELKAAGAPLSLVHEDAWVTAVRS